MDFNRFARDLRTRLVNMACLVGAGAVGVALACWIYRDTLLNG